MERDEIVEILNRYKKIIIVGLLVILICFLKFILFPFLTDNNKSQVDNELLFSSSDTFLKSSTTQEIKFSKDETGYIDIKGAINKPGMYPFQGDTRVFDIVNKAGGFTSEADESRVNLALKVSDQMIIFVPKIGEELVENFQASSVDTSVSSEDSSKININTATIEELLQLNGIGEKKAQVIINYREEKGSFHSIEEIKQVSGIGEKTFETIQKSITIE